ncbi:MAG: hypothetical protein K8R73_12625, partial [Clostridiales bacterium]|nr:hypothetical protein [Clostridiales bacterium]
MTKLRDYLEDWVNGKHKFMYSWAKEFGTDGVVEICQFLAEKESAFGFGFTEKGDFLANIGYNSGLSQGEFANGLLKAASYKSDNMFAFMINAISYSRSINRVIIESADFNSNENIETYFNLLKSYKYYGIPLTWEEAASISKILLQEIGSNKEASRKNVVDCAYSLSLPTMASLLIEKYNVALPTNLRVREQNELLALVLHVLIWPYPVEITDVNGIVKSLDLLIAATQKLPVTNLIARLLKNELPEFGKRFKTDWYEKNTSHIQGESSRIILKDALEKNYLKIHSYVDRIVSNGTFQNELHNFIRLTICEGMRDKDKMNRIPLINYLAEMDRYCSENYSLVNEGNSQIDPGLAKKLDDFIKYLSMVLMANFGKEDNSFTGPTPENVLEAIPDLKSKQGIYLLTQKINSIGDKEIIKLLEDTREKISNLQESNYPSTTHKGDGI